MKKPHLPQKTCVVCGRPFAWRRRWARCWEEVRYCSARCRGQRHATTGGDQASVIAPR